MTGQRTAIALLVLAVFAAGCSVARRADQLPVTPRSVPLPTAVAPPQAEGLDGSAGEPAAHACAAVAKRSTPGARWTAKKFPWNDGGLPALDLCTLMVGSWPVQIGVSALPAQPDSLARLADAAGFDDPAVDLGATADTLGPEARSGDHGVVFRVNERVVRITTQGALAPADLLALAEAVRAIVPEVLRNARRSDAACQVSNSKAEQFIGALVQLRRDYRVNGALTCIWGTYDATVSIVESFHPDSIPEARQTPPPRSAPIGLPGYYLPERGELVFRQGRRVVRVSGITDPARAVPMDTLIDLVEPLMPLFIR
ncbi:hypothetical protein FB561_5481 [Kribbella amoyensis]|uniref:DUF3558 domain-containing protein n=1 Tax=Kribbella amoyensis TaxID=996641 RepID=A0A561BZF6_9ACTN|nr:hypothetical protein [Kribbella amoyensis]TWD84306.1 hypothetical protein FB561_5481 [Kribbella amoyensis]